MAHDLFISYSTKDKTTADEICARMESGGVRCWYAPRDIEPGTDWAESIIRAIDGSKVMVLIFTKDSNVSRQVLREVNYAVGKGVTIIPLRLTDNAPIERMQYYLSAVHWIDARNAELDEKIEELYQTCKAVIDMAPTDVLPTANAAAGSVVRPTGKKSRKGLLIGLAVAAAVIVAVVLIGKNALDRLDKMTEPSPAAAQERSDAGSGGGDEAATAADRTEAGEAETASMGKGNPNARIGSLSENAGKELPAIASGTTMSALTTDGHIAYDDGWYYFRSHDDDKLYRMREDGSDAQKLSDYRPKYINVYDGYVYFTTDGGSGDAGVFRVSTEGEHESMLFGTDVSFLFVRGNTVYFREYDEMYALDLSLVDEDYFLDIPDDDLKIGSFGEDAWPFECCFDENYIYYVSMEDDLLYRAKYDCSDVELLLDHGVYGLTIADRCLYFNDSDTGYLGSYDLRDGSYFEYTGISGYDDLNITGDGIICVDRNYNLVHFDPSTGEETILDRESGLVEVCLCNGKLYCDDLNDYFLMDPDGGNRIKL